MRNIYFTLSIIFCSSYLQSNPLNGFNIGVGPSIGIIGSDSFEYYESIPSGGIVVLTTPYLYKLGPFESAASLAFGHYSVPSKWQKSFDYSLIGMGWNFLVYRFITAEFQLDFFGDDFGYRSFGGLSFERITENLPINLLVGGELFVVQKEYGSIGWTSITARFDYPIGGKVSRKSGSTKGPSAKVDTKDGVSKPGATGSSEVDNFVTSTFDLNDNIVDLKTKLESVSSGLNESKKILADIGNSTSGPLGWAMMELQKGIARSKNSIISSVQSLQSDVPDLPEVYFDLIKESLIAPQFLAELAKKKQPEEALLLTFNKKAEEKGIPTTSKDWIMKLNLDLDPTKTLRTRLGTIKDGVLGGKDKLASVPDDLKGIGSQAQTLSASATELPKVAKSLGLKAPKALKAIKATTDVLKNIPNEVKSIGDETNRVLKEFDQVLKDIQSILSKS